MRKLSAFVLALLLIGASTAAAQDVRYNYDNKANFSAFKTYKWVAMKQEQPVNDLVAQQIRDRRGCAPVGDERHAAAGSGSQQFERDMRTDPQRSARRQLSRICF